MIGKILGVGALGALSLYNGICKALFMLFPINAIGCFCCFNDAFSSDYRFSFVFSSSTIVQLCLAKRNGIFVRQLRR